MSICDPKPSGEEQMYGNGFEEGCKGAAATIARLEDEAKGHRLLAVLLETDVKRLEAELLAAMKCAEMYRYMQEVVETNGYDCITAAIVAAKRLEAENARLLGLLREAISELEYGGDVIGAARIKAALAEAQPASTEGEG